MKTRMYTPDEVAGLLQVAPQTMRLWRMHGTGPKYIRISHNRVLYAETDVESFISERTFARVSEEPKSKNTAKKKARTGGAK